MGLSNFEKDAATRQQFYDAVRKFHKMEPFAYLTQIDVAKFLEFIGNEDAVEITNGTLEKCRCINGPNGHIYLAIIRARNNVV